MLQETLQAIDDIVARLNTHPDYSEKRKTHVFGAVRAESSRHSVGIEFKVERSKGKVRTQRRESSIRHLEQANRYLAMHGISLGILSVLGNLVEPEGHTYPNFRKFHVQFGRFDPPSSEAVIYRINDLVADLKDPCVGPVTRAVEAHLEMVRIHPYEDGNGRAARLLQNFCLEQRAYPPALIHAEDRDTYLKLIGHALDDRYAAKSRMREPSKGECKFREFIAAKVLDSASRIEHELQNRSMYSVEFSSKVDKEVLYSTAKQIRSKGRRDTSKGVSVRVDYRSKEPSLEITGVIDVTELRRTLEKSLPAKSSSYKIKKV
ncbi:MAG: Fic family protein [Candidatus Woesearchaeota archaeon]